MTDRIFDRIRVIDTDTHITEPPDVWTARVSTKKWGDSVPHVKQVDGRDAWFIRDQRVGSPGFTTMAGFNGSIPDSPRGYNDFLVEWCSADPNRLVPVAAMPFWDVKECVKEVERAVATGRKAVLACSQPGSWGEPSLADRYWDPFWAAVQEARVPISFQIGAGDLSDLFSDPAGLGVRANFARVSSMLFMQNVTCIADLIFGGVCHRFPSLKRVSVESGVGWIQSYLEAADWQFVNSETRKEHPEYDLLPSEYVKRQIYGCFWFECEGLASALHQLPDNLLWETDFPHPTCPHPGLEGGRTEHPADYAERVFEGVSEATIEKVLHGTAAELYGIAARPQVDVEGAACGSA